MFSSVTRCIRTLSAVCAAIIVLVFAAQSATAQQQRPVVEEIVRITFGSFKHALMNREGVLAASYIDDDTIALHEKYRHLALTAPKEVLLKERLSVLVGALSVRQYFTREDIQNINGRVLFAKFVAIGNTGSASAFQSLTIVQVIPERSGLSAIAVMGAEGYSETIRFKFFYHQGRWLIYLMELLETASAELEGKIGITPRTPPDVVEGVITTLLLPALAEQSGRPVSAEIWAPLAQRK